MFFGPHLAALLCGIALLYLFKVLRDSDRIAEQKLAVRK